MKDITLDDPLYQQIQMEIDKVEKKVHRQTFLFYLIRVTQIILGGIITFLSGQKGNPNTDWILPLSTLLTAITAVDTLFQFDAKKNTFQLVLFELRAIRSELVFDLIKDKTKCSGAKDLFAKYTAAKAYMRDLIGSEDEKKPTGNQKSVLDVSLQTTPNG